MLAEKEVKEKLQMYADKFKTHFRNKEYHRAKRLYDSAVTVSVFLEMEEEFNKELFGERGERGAVIKQGQFREEDVIKTYEECIKEGKTSEKDDYRKYIKK